jgi:hypothetical protein
MKLLTAINLYLEYHKMNFQRKILAGLTPPFLLNFSKLSLIESWNQ